MQPLSRRRFIQAGGAVAVGAAASPLVGSVTATGAGASGSAPNIVWICSDDQRFDDQWVMRKALPRLFNQATKFTGFMTSRPVCQPSRASYITGQYAKNHKVTNNNNVLGDPVLHSRNQLPVWLQNAGYYTACLGKYLNSFQATDALPPGWDDFHGHCSTGNGNGANYKKWTINNNGTLVPRTGYIEDENVQRSQTIVSNWRNNSSKPLFMYVGTTAPHDGSGMVAPRYAGKNSLTGWAPSWRPNFNEADVTDKPNAIKKLGRFTDQKIKSLTNTQKLRLQSLLAVDDVVDSLLTALGADLANTIVIYTSDNGWMNGEHRIGGGKSVVYEESARVPLYIMGPGFPAGTTIPSVCSGVDLTPTICELAGATPGRVQDGRSIVSYPTNPELGLDRCVLIDDAAYRAVRTTYWKYVLYNTKEEELYDLKNDPYELVSRHADPAYAQIKQLLKTALTKIATAVGPAALVTVPPIAALTASVNGLSVQVDGSTSIDLDSTLTYAWDFGDGNTATGVSAQHDYATRGTYTVKLTVTNARGATATATKSVTTGNVSPVAAFTWTASELTVTFDASTSTDPDGGSIASYAWVFGDGGTATGVAPQYTYAADGTYTVTLTVTDDNGSPTSTSQDVTVATTPVGP